MPGSEAKGSIISILTADEVRAGRLGLGHHRELMHSLRSIRYCKAELYSDCVLGTVRVPQKNESRSPQLSFGFCLTGGELILIEESGKLRQWLVRHAEALRVQTEPQGALLCLLGELIADDVLYLSHLEGELEKLEDTLSGSVPDDFLTTLTRFRQKLSELNAYYEQLTAMGERIAGRFPGEAWENYTRSAERLQNHVGLLREGIIQLRELYQARLTATQNRVMGILTIVTTIFLPLTLLTGWYGMNFDMPELSWRYGYFAVIAAAVVVVVLEIIYFRRKKFF